MTWHYQIIKNEQGYSVHEVIDGDSWTEEAVAPFGETRDELRQSFTDYINDIIFHPILVVEGDKIVGEEEPISELLTLEFIKNTKHGV